MNQQKISREIMALSPELQRQVIDFVAFLRERYAKPRVTPTSKRTSLREEPFVGMWRNRKDMRDSTKLVRELRQREWMNGNG